MKTFTITISGNSLGDVLDALKEVKGSIERGSMSGFDDCDSGSFRFSSEGEYSTPLEILTELCLELGFNGNDVAVALNIPYDRLNDRSVSEALRIGLEGEDDVDWLARELRAHAEELADTSTYEDPQ